MTTLQETCDFLRQALAKYAAARSIPAIETAILAMHTGLENAFRACLEGNDRLPIYVSEELTKPGGVSFPDLVDLMGDFTHVLGSDPGTRALLVSLNTTRVRIAHPVDKPPQEQIVKDAWRLAQLIAAFWPRLFAGTRPPTVTPVTMAMVRGGLPPTSLRPAPPPAQPSVAPEAREKPRPALLRSLWRGKTRPSRWLLRLLGVLIVAVLASLAWKSALALARWPPPVKTVSLALVVVALGLMIWGGWLLWRLLRLLGLRRILILLCVLYISLVSVRVLTAAEERPFIGRILSQMQSVAGEAWGALAGFARSLIQAPATFRFAYTGRSPLVSVPGAEVDSTPIEGDIIEPLVYATLDQLTPTPTPAPAPTPTPSKPPASGGIHIGGYVQVSGTGGKTLRARSGPGTSYDIVTRFDEGTQLRVLDGPVEADAYLWWKVSDDQREGWCADRWLMPVK